MANSSVLGANRGRDALLGLCRSRVPRDDCCHDAGPVPLSLPGFLIFFSLFFILCWYAVAVPLPLPEKGAAARARKKNVKRREKERDCVP